MAGPVLGTRDSEIDGRVPSWENLEGTADVFVTVANKGHRHVKMGLGVVVAART